jgi:hypothetical protein
VKNSTSVGITPIEVAYQNYFKKKVDIRIPTVDTAFRSWVLLISSVVKAKRNYVNLRLFVIISHCTISFDEKQLDLVINFFIDLQTSHLWSLFIPDASLESQFMEALRLHDSDKNWPLLALFQNITILVAHPCPRNEDKNYRYKARKAPLGDYQKKRGTEVSKADYQGLLGLQPLIKALMLDRQFETKASRDTVELHYLKSCLLLLHIIKIMGLAPHTIFYLKFSKF